MTEQGLSQPELPNFITLLAEAFHNNAFLQFLHLWQNVVYSLIAVLLLAIFAYLATRKLSRVPGKIQNFAEILVEGIDNFICGILGPQGRTYTPFLGTLFLYIFLMNALGLIPLLKSPTTSWSTTLALGICVFLYVQYTGFRTMGFRGYLDHLAGKPRGIIAFSIFLPLMIFLLHVVAEFIRPISLSLRLRSNIWGDDLLLAVLAGFGLKGLPLLVLNILSGLMVAAIQAVVFSLLSTIYFALVLVHEE